MAAMDSKTTSTSSSYQNQIKNQLPIQQLFSANDNKSETTAKFHRQLVLAGVEGPVMESILLVRRYASLAASLDAASFPPSEEA